MMKKIAIYSIVLGILLALASVQPAFAAERVSSSDLLDALEFEIRGPKYCPIGVVGECRLEISMRNTLGESDAQLKTDIQDAILEVYYMVGESKKTMSRVEVNKLEGGRDSPYTRSVQVYFSNIIEESDVEIVATFSLGGSNIKEISHDVQVLTYANYRTLQKERSIYAEQEVNWKTGDDISSTVEIGEVKTGGVDSNVLLIGGAVVVGYLLITQTNKSKRRRRR